MVRKMKSVIRKPVRGMIYAEGSLEKGREERGERGGKGGH